MSVINLALFMLVYVAMLPQPSVTISWNTPTNSGLPIVGYNVYNGNDMRIITNFEAFVTSNSIVSPVTVGSNKFWWIRTVNDRGMLSQ